MSGVNTEKVKRNKERKTMIIVSLILAFPFDPEKPPYLFCDNKNTKPQIAEIIYTVQAKTSPTIVVHV
jgi:hypothetical protein